MRIIARKTLVDFWERPEHRDAEQPLKAWFAEAKVANWRRLADIKAKYRHASILGGNRVVFNIAGHKYRLVVKFDYRAGIGYIRFVGTHAEYDKIDAETI